MGVYRSTYTPRRLGKTDFRPQSGFLPGDVASGYMSQVSGLTDFPDQGWH